MLCDFMKMSHVTSNDYGSKMGLGWKDGLLRNNPDFYVITDWKISVDRVVKGDIDFALDTGRLTRLKEIFPGGTGFPSGTSEMRGQKYLAEIKRSCSDRYLVNKTEQFESFYGYLLNPDNFIKVTRNMSKKLKNLIRDVETTILFVYNSEDNRKVIQRLRHIFGEELKIFGHKIVPVYCPSENLIDWSLVIDNIKLKKSLKQKDLEMKQKDLEMEQKDLEMKQQNLEIEKLKRALSSRDGEETSKKKRHKK